MPEDAFGLGDGTLPDFTQDEPQAPPEEPTQEDLYPNRPEEPVAPEAPAERPRDEQGRFIKQAEESPAVPLAEGQQAPQEPQDATPAEEAVKTWAGKYKDPEALEKGYRELRDLQRRTAERAKAYEQRTQEVEFHARQMEQAVRQATDYVRQLQQQQQQPQQPQYVYDEYGNAIPVPPQQPQWTPDQVQPMVENLVEQRMAAQAQAMQQQQWNQQQYAEAAAAHERFFTAHPEVERNGEIDEDIASTILALNEAWGGPDRGGTFNIGSEESLAIAYEASQRPALRTVLEKNPAFIDDDEGMKLARTLAGQMDGITQIDAPVGRMTARTGTPVVERGSSPAPQQAGPLDEFDQAVAEYRNQNKARGSKTFFGE